MKSLFRNADSRFFDRLNAVCSILLGAGAVIAALLAMQPSLNPETGANGLQIELRGWERGEARASKPEPVATLMTPSGTAESSGG
jgi:hypothetical protein